MVQFLRLVPPDVEISRATEVEILATEVLRRRDISHGQIHPMALVDRVMGDEIVEEDEDLRLQVIERILALTTEERPKSIQPKSVLVFLWAIHPHSQKPPRFEMRAVRKAAKNQQLPLLLQEPPVPVMEKDGTVTMP